MLTTKEKIQAIESQWFDLMEERLADLAKQAEKLPPEMRMSLVEINNKDPEWEARFDLLEAALRVLRKSHPFLSENQTSN